MNFKGFIDTNIEEETAAAMSESISILKGIRLQWLFYTELVYTYYFVIIIIMIVEILVININD